MSPLKKKPRREESNPSIESSDDSSHSGVIRFDVGKVSTLTGKRRCSTETEVEGVKWKAYVRKVDLKGIDRLSIGLCISANRSSQWSIDVSVECVLVHHDDRNIVGKVTGNFQRDNDFNGYGVIEWQEVLDEEKGFIKDDKITVEVRFKITSMKGFRTSPVVDFGDANDPCHDVALIIDGEKIYINKGYLSLHSPVFKAMFFGEFVEKDKKEIELKDVDGQEFREMLRVIYPSHKKITDGNVIFLLKLADRFQFKFLLDLTEDYLLTSTVPELASKLHISDQYRLIKLQDHCLSALKTTAEFKNLKKSPIYDSLSDAMKADLFESLLEIAK